MSMMKSPGSWKLRSHPSMNRSCFVRPPVFMALLVLCVLATGCDSGDRIGNPIADGGTSEPEPIDDGMGNTPTEPPDVADPPVVNTPPGTDIDSPTESVFVPAETDIVDNVGIYQDDGYSSVDVVRIDLVTRTMAGVCEEDDQSGCTLANVLADTNSRDEFKVDIAVHFRATDYADDGLMNNAELRQRGGGARLAPQKSFRIKLDDKDRLWRGERHLQLNKHPFDNTRIRNKLSFDLMNTIAHLPGFRTQFVNLWIDDGQGPVDYGLFTHVERGDERYLERHALDTKGRLYKAEFFRFRVSDRQTLLIDEDGEPLDKDVFESVLEIENGKDHSNLVAMLDALHDPEQSFESVLGRYFNENNVVTWLAVNLLLGQQDATRHNYFLYNPKESETFYFLPWDYDLTFEDHEEPPNALSAEALKARLDFGYAVGSNNEFIESFYRRPGTHEKILAAATELRNNLLSDTTIAERAALLSSAVAPFASRAPDIVHNPTYYINSSDDFASKVAFNHAALQNSFSIPLPPTLAPPQLVQERWQISWIPAHELTGHALTYDLQIATTVDFQADTVVYSAAAIEDAVDTVTHFVDASRLSAGTHFVRIIARSVMEPERYWQVADNQLVVNGVTHYGVMDFVVE